MSVVEFSRLLLLRTNEIIKPLVAKVYNDN